MSACEQGRRDTRGGVQRIRGGSGDGQEVVPDNHRRPFLRPGRRPGPREGHPADATGRRRRAVDVRQETHTASRFRRAEGEIHERRTGERAGAAGHTRARQRIVARLHGQARRAQATRR